VPRNRGREGSEIYAVRKLARQSAAALAATDGRGSNMENSSPYAMNSFSAWAPAPGQEGVYTDPGPRIGLARCRWILGVPEQRPKAGAPSHPQDLAPGHESATSACPKNYLAATLLRRPPHHPNPILNEFPTKNMGWQRCCTRAHPRAKPLALLCQESCAAARNSQ